MFINEKAENESESSQVLKLHINKMTNRYKNEWKSLIFRLFYDSKFGGYRVAKQSDMRRIIRKNNKCRKEQN